MQELPLAKAFMLIEPGPVTLVTTAVGRRKNIMTISWTLVMDFTPKLAFVTGAWNHSFHALMEGKLPPLGLSGSRKFTQLTSRSAAGTPTTPRVRHPARMQARPANRDGKPH